MCDTPICNILLLGQTGVGKSSLLNYLFNDEIAETNNDNLYAQNKSYFTQPFTKNIDGQILCVTDSTGITVTEQKTWLNNLHTVFAARDNSAPIENWYHTVLYCINCAGSRIQDIDYDIITYCIAEKTGVIAVFTHADYLSDEETEEFITAFKQGLNERNIPSDSMPLICRCNSSAKNRNTQFGKQELLAAIQEARKITIGQRLAQIIINKMQINVTNWKESQIKCIPEKVHYFTESNIDLVRTVNSSSADFTRKVFTDDFKQITICQLQKTGLFSETIPKTLFINEIPEIQTDLKEKKLGRLECFLRFLAAIPAGIGIAIWAVISRTKEKNRFKNAVNKFADNLEKECKKQEEILSQKLRETLK